LFNDAVSTDKSDKDKDEVVHMFITKHTWELEVQFHWLLTSLLDGGESLN
jgi:hypothetical protein